MNRALRFSQSVLADGMGRFASIPPLVQGGTAPGRRLPRLVALTSLSSGSCLQTSFGAYGPG